MGQRRGARAICLAEGAQTLLRPPPRVVRADGRALLRDVVGAGRTSADGAGGNRAAATFAAARAERARLRLGKPAGGAIMESGALCLMGRGSRFAAWIVRDAA